MTGQQHFAQAERLLARSMLNDLDAEADSAETLAAAQVHATLALTCAVLDRNASGAEWVSSVLT